MNKFLLKLITLLLVLAGIASSCNPEPEKEYPIELSFTEYSLSETSCQWINLPYDEKVLIINSKTELEKYISCTEGSYPPIDFAKYSLLLASGKVNHEISKIYVKNLQQLSSKEHKLDVEIGFYTDNYIANNLWNTVLLVEKLNKDSYFELSVTLKETKTKIIYPIQKTNQNIVSFFDIALPDYPLTSTCFFTTTYYDACLLINSISEFQQACVCTDVLPEIDFDLYTLIIGRYRVRNPCYLVSELKIVENNNLTLLIDVVNLNKECPQTVSIDKYHWEIYPKLSDKPFIVKYLFE